MIERSFGLSRLEGKYGFEGVELTKTFGELNDYRATTTRTIQRRLIEAGIKTTVGAHRIIRDIAALNTIRNIFTSTEKKSMTSKSNINF